MSIEAVNQFLEQVSSNQQLQAEVTQAMEEENDRLAVTQLAAKHGFKFTPEELGSQVEKSLESPKEDELSEAELESVAGGRGTVARSLGKSAGKKAGNTVADAALGSVFAEIFSSDRW